MCFVQRTPHKNKVIHDKMITTYDNNIRKKCVFTTGPKFTLTDSYIQPLNGVYTKETTCIFSEICFTIV